MQCKPSKVVHASTARIFLLHRSFREKTTKQTQRFPMLDPLSKIQQRSLAATQRKRCSRHIAHQLIDAMHALRYLLLQAGKLLLGTA